MADQRTEQIATAVRTLLDQNGGPIRSLENREAAGADEDHPEDYVMVRREDFQRLAELFPRER